MTDRNTHTPDLVEDRVRRTFAARAEDMAPGDSAGALPDLGRDGRAATGRSSVVRRPVLAAAVVVVVVAAAAVALVARDGDRDAGRLTTVSEQPSSEAEVTAATDVTALRALVDALHAERSLATTTLMGIEDAIVLPVTDPAQARRDTDAAIAVFVAASPDEAAHQTGLDGLGILDELRRDIDADTGPRTLDNVDAAQDVFDRYAGIVGPLLDGQQVYAETIDDPVVRTGVLVHEGGLRLREQTTGLEQASLLAVVLPGTQSVTELARLRTGVQLGMEALVLETAGTPFEEAAVTVVGEVGETGLLEAAESAIDGTVDLSVIMDAADQLQHESWPAFLDRVEETLAAEG
jgi:hypothetical protein